MTTGWVVFLEGAQEKCPNSPGLQSAIKPHMEAPRGEVYGGTPKCRHFMGVWGNFPLCLRPFYNARMMTS